MKTVTARQADGWLAAREAVLIDVRQPDEFVAGHIPYAVSVPLADLPSALPTLRLAPGAKLIFQCASGARAGRACELARGVAGLDVYNLEGGIEAWRAQRLPVSGSGPRISLFRQVQMIVGALVAGLVLAGFAGFTVGFALAGILGGMLAFAGLTGWCGLALLLSQLPWNRTAPAA